MLRSLLSCIILSTGHSFQVTDINWRRKSSLFGITEWREGGFDNYSSNTSNELPPTTTPVCLLPVSSEELIFQGETKYVHLQGTELEALFEETMNRNSGVLALGLFDDEAEDEDSTTLLDVAPLCEVERVVNLGSKNNNLGIFCQLRAVGRCHVHGLRQTEPYFEAQVTEMADVGILDVEEANVVADRIERLIMDMSDAESSPRLKSPFDSYVSVSYLESFEPLLHRALHSLPPLNFRNPL